MRLITNLPTTVRTPLNLVIAEATKLGEARSCGTCTACCVLPRILPKTGEEVLPNGKRGYTPCPHLATGAGCTIYHARPAVCRDFVCLWRAGYLTGDERRRPDNLGVMFTADGYTQANGKAVLEAWELWPGALQDHPGRGVLDALRDARYVVACRYYGVPASFEYKDSSSLLQGGQLSKAATEGPAEPLAAYIRGLIALKLLEVPEEEGVMEDIEALERGETVKIHLHRK